MALRMASTSTPTSAKTAIHMLASPVAPSTSTSALTARAKITFCQTIFMVRRDPHGQRDLGRVVVHQDNVRGLNGGIAAQGAHGDTDIGAGQNRSIIDAIANHAYWHSVFLIFLNVCKLILWHTVCLYIFNMKQRRYRICSIFVISSQKDGAYTKF